MNIIETKRLFLRLVNHNDTENLFEYFSDDEVMKYSKVRDRKNIQEWIEWNIENYKNRGFGKWAIINKEDGCFLGDAGISIQNIDGQDLPEIGYRLNKKFWGKGIATEAVTSCINYAFDQLKINFVYSYMNKQNISSVKVAERCGMKMTKEYRDQKSNEQFLVFCIEAKNKN